MMFGFIPLKETFAQSDKQQAPSNHSTIKFTITDKRGTHSATLHKVHHSGEPDYLLFTSGKQKKKLYIDTAMSNLNELHLSPDERYLAIDSSAEGVSGLTILDLTELVTNKKEKVLFSFTDHMTTASIEGWQGTKLFIESNNLLTHHGENLMIRLKDAEKFAFDTSTGKIMALTANALDPVPYFIKHLNDQEESDRAEAINALVKLKAKTALPNLQQLLQIEKSDYLKEELKKAIEELSR